jgi:hypothetical protein
MIKIVYPICSGMDIYKSFVVSCIASTDDKGVTTYKSKRFSTFNQWLAVSEVSIEEAAFIP